MDSVIDGVFDPVEMLALEVCNDSFHVVAWTASQGSVPSCWPAMPALVSLGGASSKVERSHFAFITWMRSGRHCIFFK